ncbi:MAG: anthranilate phosphoribosyltransferase [Chthoniobacterales bacterium]
MSLLEAIEILQERHDLDRKTCRSAALELFAPSSENPRLMEEKILFLRLLRAKKESVEELLVFLELLEQNVKRVPNIHSALDIVGTGGDGANTINISTGAALLAASCGIKVAKHGNRAASSRAGSADVLEALGIRLSLAPEKIAYSIDQLGFGFCYAPDFYPELATLRVLRQKIQGPTIFNFLGPLLNPALTRYYLLGVVDPMMASVMASVLQRRGVMRSMVVCGTGLDELSTAGMNHLLEVTDGTIKSSVLDPHHLGLNRSSVATLRGGDATTNAQLIRDACTIKRGDQNAIVDTLILNAAVALQMYGLHDSIMTALAHVREQLYSGATERLLDNLITFSNDS